MDERYHRIEMVRQFRVLRHTKDRYLRRCARQHSDGCKKCPKEEYDPPPADVNCSNGPIDAKQTADFVPAYRIGRLLFLSTAVTRCRGPPFHLNFQNLDEMGSNHAGK